jgi:hypothetical protein
MKKVQIGNIFEIDTPNGKGYLHYIYNNNVISVVRVLQGLHKELLPDLESLASMNERYLILFPVQAAVNKKIIKPVGSYPETSYAIPPFMRNEYNVKGVSLGWHIVNTANWHRQHVENLTAEQLKLSPWESWNDTLLVERLVSDWKLEDWK